MTRAEAARWRRRWTSDALAGIRQQLVVQSRVVKGPHPLTAPWAGTDEGSVDLRGVNVGADGLTIRYLTLHRVDLSFARGAISVFESELFDSRFDFMTLTGQTRFNRRFQRCSFRQANLTGLVLGPQVIDCDFTGSAARRLRSAPNTVFQRCTFDGTDLCGAAFRDTTFVDCSFNGTRLSGTTVFERCSLRSTRIDFAEARVHRCVDDGIPIPDRWEGKTAANAAQERYLSHYRRAIAAGDEDTMPLGPDDHD